MAFVSMNDFARASADLDVAIELNPTDATAFLGRGVLRAKRGGEDEASLADMEHAVELAPQTPETHGILGLFQYMYSKREAALENCRKALEQGVFANVAGYYAYIWLIQAQAGQEEAGNRELRAYLDSLSGNRTNEWSAFTARFFTGSLQETSYLGLATTAAKRPSAIPDQISESLYYAAMKRKLAGDKSGAIELLRKCLATKNDNSLAYMNAGLEIRALGASN
jgi:lipoprotein NlpI